MIGTDKDFYRHHVGDEWPLFYQPFYLEAVNGDRWGCSYFTKNEKLVAIMPYAFPNGNGKLIRQPALTIYQGPVFSRDFSSFGSLSDEMEILGALEESLPPYHYYNQNWHPHSINWLPFYWRGYVQSTRYSYVITPTSDIQQVRDGYSENVRRNIRKAATHLAIEEDVQSDFLLSLIRKTFDRKDMSVPYDRSQIQRVVQACLQRSAGKILLAKRGDEIHAAMLLFWDRDVVYYMAGGIDERFKSGAMSLLFDSAITWALSVGKTFDFEGSMIPSVEKFFRSFGARQHPYFVVTKVSSSTLQLRLQLAKLHSVFSPFN